MSKLSYGTWADNRNEALPVGNGRIGAMVYGHPYEDVMALNEETLWSGSPAGEELPYNRTVISHAADLLSEHKYNDAETYLNMNLMKGIRTETYLPLGKLRFHLDYHYLLEVKRYQRDLVLLDGILISEADIRCRHNAVDSRECIVHHKKEYFVSLADDVFVMRFTADRSITVSIALDPSLDAKVEYSDNGIYASGRCPTKFNEYNAENILEDDPNRESIPFAVRVGFITDGRCIGEGKSVSVRGAKAITLILSIATGFNGYNRMPISEGRDYETLCRDKLDAAMQLPYDDLKSRHIELYQAQYNRTELVLEGDSNKEKLYTDERIKRVQAGEEDVGLEALLFDYAKYLTISSSQPGGQPSNLQGIWNEDLLAPWNCNYTLNINTQMNYWCTELLNLPECCLPLMEMTKELSERGSAYGGSGWCTAHNTDIWRFNRMATKYAMYGLWDMGGVWLARHIYDHYCFTQDKDFLNAYIGVLRGVYDFLEDRLQEDKDGHLRLSPSTSPETTFFADGKECSVTSSAAMDLEMIEDYLTYMQELETILGASTEKYSKMCEKLLPLSISRDGSLLEYGVDLPETPHCHQHLSHLYGIYPANTIKRNTVLYDAARKSLDDRINKGGGVNGWANIWTGLCYARFGDGESAHDRIRFMLQKTVYPNLLNICPPFQIDGNFGVCALICEMLVQSHDGKYRLLPALPSSWKNGHIHGIKLRNGRTVSFSWKNGEVFDLQYDN